MKFVAKGTIKGMSKEPMQLETEVSKPPLIEEIPLELENQQEKSPLFQALETLYCLPERDEGGNFGSVVSMMSCKPK